MLATIGERKTLGLGSLIRLNSGDYGESVSNSSNIAAASRKSLSRAAEMIRNGELVAFPTETVYGLGADATNDQAVAGIFEAKKRPAFNPLIVHVCDLDAASALGELDLRAMDLARKFWPGPLTLVVPRAPESAASLLVSAGLDTIALRMPNNKIAMDLLVEAGGPIAAPSANLAGTISPTTAQHVSESLGDSVPLILDGGPCKIGVESTIVQCDDANFRLLRHGGIPQIELEEFLGEPLSCDISHGEFPLSPGQLTHHYAPKQRVRLNAVAAGQYESLLAFGPRTPQNSNYCLNLSPTGDLKEAAANLFAMMHELDKLNYQGIAVMKIPESGLGVAINDRLRRAATQPNETTS